MTNQRKTQPSPQPSDEMSTRLHETKKGQKSGPVQQQR